MGKSVGGCKGERIQRDRLTHSFTYINKYIYIYHISYIIYTHICVCTRICLVEINMHAYTYTHIDMHTCACLHMHSCPNSCTQAMLRILESLL